MDPNETLKMILRMVNDILNKGDDCDGIGATELAQSIVDLDFWIGRGGFLPDTWNQNTLALRATIEHHLQPQLVKIPLHAAAILDYLACPICKAKVPIRSGEAVAEALRLIPHTSTCYWTLYGKSQRL